VQVFLQRVVGKQPVQQRQRRAGIAARFSGQGRRFERRVRATPPLRGRCRCRNCAAMGRSNDARPGGPMTHRPISNPLRWLAAPACALALAMAAALPARAALDADASTDDHSVNRSTAWWTLTSQSPTQLAGQQRTLRARVVELEVHAVAGPASRASPHGWCTTAAPMPRPARTGPGTRPPPS
jgi:hypothetical protein